MKVEIYKDAADGQWHIWCRSEHGYPTMRDAYTAAADAHPKDQVAISEGIDNQ